MLIDSPISEKHLASGSKQWLQWFTSHFGVRGVRVMIDVVRRWQGYVTLLTEVAPLSESKMLTQPFSSSDARSHRYWAAVPIARFEDKTRVWLTPLHLLADSSGRAMKVEAFGTRALSGILAKERVTGSPVIQLLYACCRDEKSRVPFGCLMQIEVGEKVSLDFGLGYIGIEHIPAAMWEPLGAWQPVRFGLGG